MKFVFTIVCTAVFGGICVGGEVNQIPPFHIEWNLGEAQPVKVFDLGPDTTGGYAVFKVGSFSAQGKDADGKVVGYPVLRIAYATHPDGLTSKGCFTRRGCAHYLGDTFDNPVLPANVNRFEIYTITHSGVYVAPLVQGQERYVRVQLDTPGTAVDIEEMEIRNVGVYSTEPVVGSFRCSDERMNRVWEMSAWTCNLASIPNNDAWRVVAGRLLPRKLERGREAGLCEKAQYAGDGEWSMDFALSANPHHDSAVGLMLRADGPDDGIVAIVSQPAYCRIFRRKAGKMQLLKQMVLDERIIDGVPCRLSVRAEGNMVSLFFNAEKIIAANVGDMPSAGKFGIYVEKEWWPEVTAFTVKDAKGQIVFSEDFKNADVEGRLAGWDYTKSFKFMADGGKRDRLVWLGDLWWAERTCFAAYAPTWPYLRESLRLFAYYQTPEGYIWASPFSEKGLRPGKGEFGHFPSDEFTAWFSPVLWDYLLFTGDRELAVELYPAVEKVTAYLLSHCREDGVFEQRIETSSHACSMDPVDPTHRFFMNVVLWKSLKDAARIARELGHAEDAQRWDVAADKTARGTRTAFWRQEQRAFLRSLEKGGFWTGSLALALATGFATREEALDISKRISYEGENKFHLLAVRGRFRYGFNEAAWRTFEGGTWFKLCDPGWKGAHCCTECGFLTRKNWWDESHPDTTVAGVFNDSILGIEPIELGFRRFVFAPHPIERLSFVEGTVPTSHGMIRASWKRIGKNMKMSLEVPTGTVANGCFSFAGEVMMDGMKYTGGDIISGGHVFEARDVKIGMPYDPSLVGMQQMDSDGWVVLPEPGVINSFTPDYEFTQVLDLGEAKDIRCVEFTAWKETYFPAEIRIDVSEDGVAYRMVKELTAQIWPGEGKSFEEDLRTVGGALRARFVRFRLSRPPSHDIGSGDLRYTVRLGRIRVRYR